MPEMAQRGRVTFVRGLPAGRAVFAVQNGVTIQAVGVCAFGEMFHSLIRLRQSPAES